MYGSVPCHIALCCVTLMCRTYLCYGSMLHHVLSCVAMLLCHTALYHVMLYLTVQSCTTSEVYCGWEALSRVVSLFQSADLAELVFVVIRVCWAAVWDLGGKLNHLCMTLNTPWQHWAEMCVEMSAPSHHNICLTIITRSSLLYSNIYSQSVALTRWRKSHCTLYGNCLCVCVWMQAADG